MTGPDRRRAPRREPHPAEALSKVRLRTGRELQVVNIGPAGVLVQAAARLLPGTWVDVHVMTPDGRELVRSRVVRAYVSQLSGDAVIYRGALAFDRFVDVGAVVATAIDATGVSVAPDPPVPARPAGASLAPALPGPM